MAAAMEALFVRQSRQTTCSSVLLNCTTPHIGVFTNTKYVFRIRNLPGSRIVRYAHGSYGKSAFYVNQIFYRSTRRIIDFKSISARAVYFYKKDARYISGGRNLNDRIEKIREMRENILTIPNLLSAFRIAAAPFLGYFIITGQFTFAVSLFGVAGITDMLDGFIARNFKNQKSVFGTLLDPIADKVLISTLTISLTVAELLPIPLTVLILSRDVLLVTAASYFRFKSLLPPKTISRYFDVNLATVELRPNILGKANTVLQLGLIGSTLLAPVIGYIGHPYLQALWFVVGTSTVLSSISYLFSSKTAVRYLK